MQIPKGDVHMRSFDYSFLEHGLLPAGFVNVNFMTTLLMCYKELDKRFAVVNSGKVSKRQRIEATVLNSLLPIGKREICYVLPDVSPTTVEAVIASMVKSGVIEKIGAGRSTKYIKR
jgi:predicted HTH transcriptional regulator